MTAPTTEQAPRLWTWWHLAAVTLARSLLAGLLGLAAWGALPAAIGWHPTTVSSGSMLPRLHVGDVAVSRPLGDHVPPLSSVLLFHDPDHPDRLRMHRFVRVDDDGLLVTRGDANDADDSSPVPLSAVVGIGTLRVPWIALPITWLREGRWFPLGLVGVGLVLTLAVAASGRDRGYPDDDEPDDPGAGSAPPSSADHEGSPTPGSRFGDHAGLRRIGVLLGTGLLVSGLATTGASFSATTTGTVALGLSGYATCASAMTALGPSIWYRMDETSSTATAATDSSGNSRTGLYGSAGKTTTTAKACAQDTGRAMTFDGSSGYLSSPQITGALPNTFSLAIRFRTTTTVGGKLIGFGNQQTGASGIYDRHLYMTNSGQVVFGLYTGAVKTLVTPRAYNDNAWHLAVATLSTAGMRLYLDGALVGSDTTVTTGESVTNGYLRIAYDNLDNWTSTPSSRFFSGTLDDAALFPTALTAAQVSSLASSAT